jgi:hypothetical protein
MEDTALSQWTRLTLKSGDPRIVHVNMDAATFVWPLSQGARIYFNGGEKNHLDVEEDAETIMDKRVEADANRT